MTSLVAWAGVDSRGPASIYLVSDSRISWGTVDSWDFGRKLFASVSHPDVFGYCGDVLFPSQLLGQFTQLADAGAYFSPAAPSQERHAALFHAATASFAGVPVDQQRAFTILHCGRDGVGLPSRFRVWQLDWMQGSGWSDRELPVPTESVLLCAVGSGERNVVTHDASWRRSSVGRTSRAVFSAFCDALRSGADPYSGGAPQLVGLYRQGAGAVFGVLFDGLRFLLGLQVPAAPHLEIVQWRNELFERCDPISMQLLPGAQRQPRPPELRPL